MKERLLCKLFKLHHYEILREESLFDSHNHLIGRVIVCKCTICGNIKHFNYFVEYGY